MKGHSNFIMPHKRVLQAALFGLMASSGFALQVTNYTAEANNRFSSGYPNAPVGNASPNFVGEGLDWSGVGWNPADATKSYGFLSPRHYLVATHYGGSANVSIFANGSVQTRSQWKVENTGYGPFLNNAFDLSLGTLNTAYSGNSGLPRYAVLDLNSASGTNTPSAYNGLELLLYGRGPNASFSTRIGNAAVSGVVIAGNEHYFSTPRTETQLEGGDSGSPALHRWTNPAGGEEITVIGNHAAIDQNSNYINFTGTHQVMGALNNLMNDDGFVLRVVGNPTNAWVGDSSTSIGNPGAWGIQSATSDQFVSFDGDTAGNGRVVTVNANHHLRGLYFLPTASQNLGFTFGGGSTLTIGRGGITNYGTSRQVFQAPLALGSSQLWNGGAGGITTAGISTNGHLLEITTGGASQINGTISGAGGLALSGGTLELTASNNYTGNTWVHGGMLVANNMNGSATGTGNVTVAAGGTLAGDGILTGNVSVTGSIAPGTTGIGSLETGTLTWNGATVSNPMTDWRFDLGSSNQSDRLDITGNFTKGTGTDFFFDFLGSSDTGSFTLITWTGMATGFSAGHFDYTNLGVALNGFFTLNANSLQFTAIPEPTPALAGILLGLGLMRRRRPVELA